MNVLLMFVDDVERTFPVIWNSSCFCALTHTRVRGSLAEAFATLCWWKENNKRGNIQTKQLLFLPVIMRPQRRDALKSADPVQETGTA